MSRWSRRSRKASPDLLCRLAGCKRPVHNGKVNGHDWFLIGAPWDCSGSQRGEQDAPEALRAAGLSDLVDVDRGDAACAIDSGHRDETTGVLALAATVRAAQNLAEALTEALRALLGRRPLVIGGDCSILLGILPALRHQVGPVGLWFIDGHPDFLDGTTSDTGETADMDLAVLTGVGAESLTGLGGPPPMVNVADIVLLGHRASDLDAGRRKGARSPARRFAARRRRHGDR